MSGTSVFQVSSASGAGRGWPEAVAGCLLVAGRGTGWLRAWIGLPGYAGGTLAAAVEEFLGGLAEQSDRDLGVVGEVGVVAHVEVEDLVAAAGRALAEPHAVALVAQSTDTGFCVDGEVELVVGHSGGVE